MPANGVPLTGWETNAACSSIGQRLCTYSELCPNGPNGGEPEGMPAQHTDWMPFWETSMDRPGWIHAGCGGHEVSYGPSCGTPGCGGGSMSGPRIRTA